MESPRHRLIKTLITLALLEIAGQLALSGCGSKSDEGIVVASQIIATEDEEASYRHAQDSFDKDAPMSRVIYAEATECRSGGTICCDRNCAPFNEGQSCWIEASNTIYVSIADDPWCATIKHKLIVEFCNAGAWANNVRVDQWDQPCARG